MRMGKKKIIIWILFSLFLEVFVFNYKMILPVRGDFIGWEDGWHVVDMESVEENVYRVLPDFYGQFEIENINDFADTLKIDLELHKESEEKSKEERILEEKQCSGVWIELWGADEGHKNDYYLGRKLISHNVKSSQYMRLQFQGKAAKLKFYVTDVPDDMELIVHDININGRIPLCFSLLRFLGMIMLMGIFTVMYEWIRVGGHAYTGSRVQKMVLGGVVGLQILIFVCVSSMNTPMVYPSGESKMQYQNLAHALADGQVALEYEPGDNLKKMENPYDRVERDRVMQETGESYRWDHAYFDGKYYVYFGVVPELLFYFPYYKLTGMDFSTHMGIIVSGCAFLIGSMFLLCAIVRKWYPETAIELMAVLYCLFVNCCGILSIMARPDFYSLPILTADAFAIWGIYFWISAMREGKSSNDFRLCVGSICIALIAGCRPQIILCAVVGLLLWGKEILSLKNNRLSLGQWLRKVLCIGVPFAVVAAGLMYYNYIRFRNPFDFGAVYNLTGADMTTRGFKLGRIPQGIYMYFFQPPSFGVRFPFVWMVNDENTYLGEFVRGRMFGGIMITVPLIWLVVWMCSKREWFREKTPYYCMLFFAVAAPVLALLDAQVAGVLMRYFSDFGWMLLLAVWFAVLSAECYLRNRVEGQYLRKITLIGTCISLGYYYLLVFANISIGGDNIMDVNPEIFSQAEHLIAFWS